MDVVAGEIGTRLETTITRDDEAAAAGGITTTTIISTTTTTTTMDVVTGEIGTRLETTITRDDEVLRKDTTDVKTADYGRRVREEIPVGHRFQHLQPLEEIRNLLVAMVGERGQLHREEIHTTPAVMEVGIVVEE
jgi:hypothetical protein